MLPKPSPNPAPVLPKLRNAARNPAFRLWILPEQNQQQNPSSASEIEPFQEHFLSFFQFLYVNFKYLKGIVRILRCLLSGNFTSRKIFWPRFSVLFKKWAKRHKIKLSSASVKLLFLTNGRTLSWETEPRKTIWEVLSEHAPRFDEACFCAEKNGIALRWSGKQGKMWRPYCLLVGTPVACARP